MSKHAQHAEITLNKQIKKRKHSIKFSPKVLLALKIIRVFFIYFCNLALTVWTSLMKELSE